MGCGASHPLPAVNPQDTASIANVQYGGNGTTQGSANNTAAIFNGKITYIIIITIIVGSILNSYYN